MDGKIFVEPNKKAPDETLYECRLQHNSNKEGRRLRVIRKLAEWTEPLTNPQSRAECLKMCSIAPWDKWCLGWKLGWQWLSCKLYLEVSVGAEREQDIFEAIECALEDEAVQRAAATIVAAISEEGDRPCCGEGGFRRGVQGRNRPQPKRCFGRSTVPVMRLGRRRRSAEAGRGLNVESAFASALRPGIERSRIRPRTGRVCRNAPPADSRR